VLHIEMREGPSKPVDLKSYFDTVRDDILLNKISLRVNDADVMRLMKLILKASGKRGVPQVRCRRTIEAV
jgi:hypothetical protein